MYALRAWFRGRHALFAWFGVVVIALHKALGVVMDQIQIEWRGRFYNLLGDATNRGSSGVSAIYPELQTFCLIVAYFVCVPPAYSWFHKYYNLTCDQAIQRAYAARWPTSAPEGSAQRVHEDVVGLRSAWQWSMGALITELGRIATFTPSLIATSAKFPLQGHIAAPPWFIRYWAPLCSIGTPLLATLVSVVIARPMKELNYTRQRHDADVRKTLVFAEDGSGLNMSALEGQLRRLMGTSMTLWRHTAAYDIWTSMYGYLPYALCFLIAAPQLFSDNKDAPRLGDLQKLVAYFDAVNTSLSFFAFNMSEVNYFRSVVQRLQEFEAATVDQHEMSSVVQDCEEGACLLPGCKGAMEGKHTATRPRLDSMGKRTATHRLQDAQLLT